MLAGQTIKDLKIDIYNDGIITFKEFYNDTRKTENFMGLTFNR